jgi:hypothetical protein
MATEQGFSNQKKKGKAQFKTIHSTGSDSFGTASVSKALYDISLSDQTIVSITDILGSDGQVQFWNIEITAHLASPGNILRIVDGSLKNFEFEIISVPDANNLWILPISPSKPLLTDLARIMNWVTGKADEDGNLILTSGPVKFLLDLVPTEVSKDSAVPANTIALPVEDFAARASLVEIESELETLNTVDFATSAKQDTGNASLASIDTEIQTLNTVDFATSAKQDTGNASLSSIDTEIQTLNTVDFATSAKQDTGNASLASIDTEIQTLNTVDFATSAKQDTGNSSLSSINTNTTNIPNTIATEGGAQPSHGVVTMGHTGAGTARHILVENSGRQVVHITNSVLPTGAATSAEQITTNSILSNIDADLGSPTDAAVSNPASSASVIAAIKGLLTLIGSTNTKLDSIELNTSPEFNSHETQVVTSASAVTFTAPANAKRMVIQNSLLADGGIRFTAAAGTPSASDGFYLGVGQSTSEIPAGSLKAIATTASENGNVTVIWFV